MRELEPLLLAWGAWLDAGGRVAGYPQTNTLHPSWAPPAPGAILRAPTPRSDASLRQVHAAVAELPPKLRDALVLTYVLKVSPAERAQRAGCTPAGLAARVQRARRALAGALAPLEHAAA